MQLIQMLIQMQWISAEATEIILKSWRSETSKQYKPYIKKWIQHCPECWSSYGTVGQTLEFPLGLFKKGLGYSALNTAPCALSCNIEPTNTVSFGSQPLLVRFLKRVYKSKPFLPRYVETWDVQFVLKFLADLYLPPKLSLGELTLKLVVLVSLVSGQLGQSIQLMSQT